MFKHELQKEFGINTLYSEKMEKAIKIWESTWMGNPFWAADDITSVKFARSVSTETARLVTLALGVFVEGSARAEYLETKMQLVLNRIRDFVEKGCVYGGVVLKPNGNGCDCLTPNDFLVTATDGNGNITGIIFIDRITKNDKRYTRLEYHRFENERYHITNRAYVSDSAHDLGKKIDLALVPEWADLINDAEVENIENPLFGYFKMPSTNNIDPSSPLGVSVFADAMTELKDLDIAYSRNAGEIFDSKKIIFLSDSLLSMPGESAGIAKTGLPDFVQMLYSNGVNDFYQEAVPVINTDKRKIGINLYLSLIGYKCGYSNGYFVFDEKTGMATATQVESEDRRTIQLIKDIRDSLKIALDGLLYAFDKEADLYDLSPVGTYEASYDFGDITYNWDEDRARHWSYVTQGKYPLWRYYEKFEGMSEEEAKAIVAEAQENNTEKGLFE